VAVEPPVRVVVTGPGPDGPQAVLGELHAEFARLDADGELLGPAALLRLRGRHRAQLLVKTATPRVYAGRAGRLLNGAAAAMRRDGLAASVDVDPQGLA
jgi:primosomal protein N'